MPVNTAWDHVNSNIFKTWIIMFLFSTFVVGIIYIFAKGYGFDNASALSLTGFALILTGLMNFVSFYFSDKIVLSVSGAKAISETTHKELYRMVENIAIAGGLPTPKIYLIDDSAPNAFATGRDPKHSAIAFTTGIIEKLNKLELEGVTAHELSHVGNRDTLVMTVVSILVGTLALVSDMFLRSLWFGGHDRDSDSKGNAIFMVLALVAAILAPVIATLIQLAVSRRREYLADASGVLLTRNPEGLATALLKISGDKEALEVANRGTAHLYIANPLKGSQAVGWFAGLFNTHPPVQDRVKALREMGGGV